MRAKICCCIIALFVLALFSGSLSDTCSSRNLQKFALISSSYLSILVKLFMFSLSRRKPKKTELLRWKDYELLILSKNNL